MKFFREHMLLITMIVGVVITLAAVKLGQQYDSMFQVADAFVDQMANVSAEVEGR